MVVPTCNFYHFLVSFASLASPEDIHKERAREGRERESERESIESGGGGEREREGERGKEGGGNTLSLGNPYDREGELRRDKGARWGRKNEKKMEQYTDQKQEKTKEKRQSIDKNRPPTQWDC